MLATATSDTYSVRKWTPHAPPTPRKLPLNRGLPLQKRAPTLPNRHYHSGWSSTGSSTRATTAGTIVTPGHTQVGIPTQRDCIQEIEPALDITNLGRDLQVGSLNSTLLPGRAVPPEVDTSDTRNSTSRELAALLSPLPHTPGTTPGRRGGWSAGAAARLSTPKEHGTSSRAARRALADEYEAYAQEAVAALVPEARANGDSIFADPWRTSGEDGYRSAVFHAAVRCKELAWEVGLPAEGSPMDGGTALALQGHSAPDAPELARLHAACLLFEEISQVVSPLQDTLRFLLRELCSCIFEGFRPGSDVSLLSPYFMLLVQARKESEAERERAELAEQELHRCSHHLALVQQEVSEMRRELLSEREHARHEALRKESLVSEHNGLRSKLMQLQESASIRSDELRELRAELTGWQGSAYNNSMELERAQRELSALAGQLKEEQATSAALRTKLEDLQGASASAHHLATPNDVTSPRSGEAIIPPASPREGGTRHRRSITSSGPAVEGRDAEGRRTLRLRLADGSLQMVLRGSVAEGRELQSLGAGGKSQATALMASPEAFAALTIALALPQPPDVLQLSSLQGGAERVVQEVRNEVGNLVREHTALLKQFRNLRQELRQTLHLIPQWNLDELRGILQSVAVLDPDDRHLLISPAHHTMIMGLGLGSKVPSFLRYEGFLDYEEMKDEEVLDTCNKMWLVRTRDCLAAQLSAEPVAPLADFLNDMYLPGVSLERYGQMQFIYNFLLALRSQTSLAETQLKVTVAGAKGLAGFQRVCCVCTIAGRPGPSFRSAFMDSPDPKWQYEAVFERYRPGEAISFLILRKDDEGCEHELGKVVLDSSHFYPDGHEGELEFAQGGDVAGAPARLLVRAASCGNGITASPPRGQRVSDTGRKRLPVPASSGFRAGPEVLYRGLLGNLHEDVHHDQTAMLAALHSTLAALSAQLPPAPGSKPLVLGLAVLSASLKHFFPAKPREHLNTLKQLLAPESAAEGTQDQPRVIDLAQAFGFCSTKEDGAEPGGDLLTSLLCSKLPLVLELRRQHLTESFMFLDRVQRAFRAILHSWRTEGSGGAEVSQASATVRQAEAALVAADQGLSEDQRRIYLLRGFGRRLPSLEVGTAASTDAVLQRGRALLRERAQALAAEGACQTPEAFLRLLASSGIAKGAKLWCPGVCVPDIMRDAGLTLARPDTVGAPLAEFTCSEGKRSPSPMGKVNSTPIEDGTTEPGQQPEADAGLRGSAAVQELSVGYPGIALHHWLSSKT